MKIISFLLLTVFTLSSCKNPAVLTQLSNNESKEIKVVNNQETQEQKEVVSTTMCGGETFTLTVITKGDKRDLNFSDSEKIIKTMDVSYLSEPYISLNSVKSSKEGFEFTVNYGSGFYYEKQFNFVCRENTFYLDKIKVTSFDKADPEKSWQESTKTILPILPIEKFLLADFLQN